jgi:hypothetical protein
MPRCRRYTWASVEPELGATALARHGIIASTITLAAEFCARRVQEQAARAFVSSLTYALLLSLRMLRQPQSGPLSALCWSGTRPSKT